VLILDSYKDAEDSSLLRTKYVGILPPFIRNLTLLKEFASVPDCNIKCFGVETLMGFTGALPSGNTVGLFFQENGEPLRIQNCREIAVSGNGFVALINNG
jgi:hypothetical protein